MSNEITYTKVGDYYLPNLALTKSKYANYKLGKYGRMRLNYLKNYKKGACFASICANRFAILHS